MLLETHVHILGLKAMYKIAFGLSLLSTPCESIMRFNVFGLQQRSVADQ